MLAGCPSVTDGLQGTESGGEAGLYIGPGTIRVEAGGTVVSGQVAATELEGSGLEDDDEVDPSVGRFRLEGDTDRLEFADGSLRSLAFEVEGGTATVYRGGQILTEDVSTFSQQFATPSPSPSPTPTPRPGTVVDGFERSSLGPYTGETDGYRTQSEETFVGERALAIDRIGNDIRSTEGLPTYPAAGDRVRFACHLGDPGGEGPAVSFRFGLQGDGGTYMLNLGRFDEGLILKRRSDGRNVALAQSRAEPPTGEWLLATVDWGRDGELRATLHRTAEGEPGEELASIRGTDRAYTGGGIGWRALDDAGSVRYVDDLRLLPSADG